MSIKVIKKEDSKRKYDSGSRDTQATFTKQRILGCARTLFQTEGFEGVTIEILAQSAHVSTATVYGLFKSKRGVLRALMEEALAAPEYETLLGLLDQEKTIAGRLRIAAKISRQMYDAEKTQMELFQGAAILAPEFKQFEKEREQRRFNRLEESFQKMEDKSNFPGLSDAKALDILWALTGRDMYRLFIIERGWTSDQYEEWLGQLLIKTLLEADLCQRGEER